MKKLFERWRQLALPVRGTLIVAAVVVVLLATADLMNTFAPGLVAALQASTTLFLVVITGFYAYFTYKLVKLQENPPYIRLAAQDQAVKEMLQLVSRHDTVHSQLLRSFPLDPANKDVMKELEEPLRELESFAEALNLIALEPPLAIQRVAVDCVNDALRALLSMKVFENALLRAFKLAGDENRQFRSGDVQHIYESVLAPKHSPEIPTWTELLRGASIEKSEESFEELRIVLMLNRLDVSIEHKETR